MIKKNIDKFYLIFNELQNITSDEFSTNELIKASNDLIKYSKNDFIDKSFLKNYDNDNRKSLDKIFTSNQKYLPIEYDYKKFEDRDIEEGESFRKFNLINNGY